MLGLHQESSTIWVHALSSLVSLSGTRNVIRTRLCVCTTCVGDTSRADRKIERILCSSIWWNLLLGFPPKEYPIRCYVQFWLSKIENGTRLCGRELAIQKSCHLPTWLWWYTKVLDINVSSDFLRPARINHIKLQELDSNASRDPPWVWKWLQWSKMDQIGIFPKRRRIPICFFHRVLLIIVKDTLAEKHIQGQRCELILKRSLLKGPDNILRSSFQYEKCKSGGSCLRQPAPNRT
jgi:hypothetical protein